MIQITSIFVRKKHSKYCVICNYRDPIDKKLKQKQLASFDKQKDAKVRLVEEKNKLNKKLFILPTKLDTYDYLMSWNELRKNNLEIRTFVYYQDMINTRIKNFFAGITLNNLNSMHIEAFYSTLANDLSKNGVVKYHRLLNKALNDAKRKRFIDFNPIDYIDPPKFKKTNTANFLTESEAKELLEISKETRYEVPIHLAILLGLRSGEVLGLSWDKVNFEKGTLIIDQVTFRDRLNNTVGFKEPKTHSSLRTINIPKVLLNRLEYCYSEFKLLKYDGIPNRFDLVFCKMDGEPLSSESFSKLFAAFLERNDFKHLRFHDLRHTNASLHLKAGTSLKVTSKNLGHSTISITADLYTHVLSELEVEAANNIDKMFS
ncbi:site-specific integrase [uncultured Clostridium sp.]|jgi:integrase|uniref:tyrosine-type recombinase/integrase n=1 Tax=uncultured Clostridium sp. TaxID=59620 RepID=UPI0026032460|nr:site-specific integrase [uncultured Clostridium sp.]